MGVIGDRIFALARQFYPTGRVWRMPFGGYFESLNKGLALSEERAFNDATYILWSILPDTIRFTLDDCYDWERRLGLITNESLTLSERKQVILLKLNFPGNIPARQAATFIERQLRGAGFDVYVYENLSGLSPLAVSSDPSLLDYIQHGQVNHGTNNHGLLYLNKVVNSIDPNIDKYFNNGGSFRTSFFIGGPTLGSFASIDESRKIEFRQAILKVKPAQDIAYLFINYYY